MDRRVLEGVPASGRPGKATVGCPVAWKKPVLGVRARSARLPLTHSASNRQAGSTFTVQTPSGPALKPVTLRPPSKIGFAFGAAV